jgi:drug/metabolite transporter (DMT)-like permease
VGIIIGAVLNLMLSFLENFSFSHISAVLGNQIIMTSSIFSLILGLLFYKEGVGLPEVAGGAIIFVSVWRANRLFALS